MARGRGGFRNIPSGGRRRSRSPPNHNNDNNNNSNSNTNNNNQQQQQQNTKPPNQAASTSTFELRRLVTQAFLKFASTELSGLEKDKVMPDIFKASDSAAFYNPVNNETRQTALDRFKSSLQDILKSNDVVDWMMEKAAHLVDPQPREQRVPVPVPARQQQQFQQQQQQQQQAPPPYAGGTNNNNGIMAFGGGRFNNNNNINNAAGVGPGAMMMNPNNNNNMNRFGNNNNMMMPNNNTRPQQQQPPLALLPDPADPKVLLIKDLPEELNEEQNIRITINNRANNNVLKAVVCEPEKNRAICFCFDESQALLLRSYPSGTVFIRAPDAKLVECDATTWKHALIRLRNRVLEQEELAMQEINKLTSEEEGISIEEVKKNQKPMGLAKIAKSTTTKTDDADSSSQQQQQQQQQAPPQKTPQEEAAIKEVAQLEKQQQDFKQGLEKYEKELSLLESLGDSISMIPGQEERKKVVEGEVAKRKKQLEECGAALDKARQTLDSFDETKKKNTQQQDENNSNNNTDSSSSQQQQDNNNNTEQGEAASQEYNAENKREKKFSSSSAAIENPRALLFFSGFPEAWSDNKILALLKYLPQATPLHVWRAPNSTMVCVELQGGASAAANIATFLSYNDFIYCDVRVTRQRPQQ